MRAVDAAAVFDHGQAGNFGRDESRNPHFVGVDFPVKLFDGAVGVQIGLPRPFDEHFRIDKRRAGIKKHSSNIHGYPFLLFSKLSA